MSKTTSSREIVRTEYIRIAMIDRHPHRIRADKKAFDAAVKARAESMNGSVHQLSPILVFENKGRYLLCDGDVRLSAAELLAWTEIRAEIRPLPADATQIHLMRGRANLDAAPMSPLDEHLLVLLLKQDLGVNGTAERIAAELGKSRRWVSDRMFLDRLSKAVRELLVGGRINLGQAGEIAQLADAGEQLEIAEAIAVDPAKGGRVYPVDEVRMMVDNKRRSLSGVPWTLDVPCFDKPACRGCPHNTMTPKQAELFHIADSASGPGQCLSASCYDSKGQKAADAQARVAAKLGQRKLAVTQENIAQYAPVGLDVPKAVPAVKRLAGSAGGSAADAAADAPIDGNPVAEISRSSQKAGVPASEKTAAAAAVDPEAPGEEEGGGGELGRWEALVREAVEKTAAADPLLYAAMVLFQLTSYGEDLMAPRRLRPALEQIDCDHPMAAKLRACLYHVNAETLAVLAKELLPKSTAGRVDLPILWDGPFEFVEMLAAGLKVKLPARPNLQKGR